jgi:hypothetical protein
MFKLLQKHSAGGGGRVQTEAAGEIRTARVEQGVGDEVGDAGRKLSSEVPPAHAAASYVAAASDYIEAVLVLLLLAQHLGDGLRMVAHVSVHDDNKIMSGELDAVHIRGTQAQLALARVDVNSGCAS